jgi:toxin FitB
MTIFVLDTNVVSEWVRPVPDPAVARWLHHTPRSALYLSAMTVGEISFGVEKERDPGKRQRLSEFLWGWVIPFFRERIVEFDASIALEYGHLRGLAARAGRSHSSEDMLIAATARAVGAVLATRDRTLLGDPHLPTLNPWDPVSR